MSYMLPFLYKFGANYPALAHNNTPNFVNNIKPKLVVVITQTTKKTNNRIEC